MQLSEMIKQELSRIHNSSSSKEKEEAVLFLIKLLQWIPESACKEALLQLSESDRILVFTLAKDQGKKLRRVAGNTLENSVSNPMKIKEMFKSPKKELLFISSFLLCILLILYRMFSFPDTKSPHLLVITIDTLRADHLGCYGYSQAETPNIDALAKEGLLFSRAYSQVPLTLPSHASIFTGTNPNFHGVRDNSFFRLRKDIPTLATILKKYGYQTAAVVSGATLSRSKGISNGFAEYDDVPDNTEDYVENSRQLTERIAEKSVDAAIKQLNRFLDTPTPFFLWLHLFDPHAEYRPPSPFRERFADRLYDGEIAYTDHCLEKLLSFLKERRISSDMIVVLMADHGEGLGEHGEASHGYYLYNTTLHIPLIIRFPGVIPAGTTVSQTMRSIDVMPTVLSLMGIEDHGYAQGRDMSYLTRNLPESPKHDNVESYAETYFPYHAFGWKPLHSLISGDYKYLDTKRGELYAISTDFQEDSNLMAEKKTSPDQKGNLENREIENERRSENTRRLAEDLKNRLLSYQNNANFSSFLDEKSEDIQKAQSLGYFSNPANSTQANDKDFLSALPDTVEMRPVVKMFIHAQSLVATRHNPEAIQVLSNILQKDENNIACLSLLGKLYSQEQNLDKALEYFLMLSKLRPYLSAPKKAMLDILVQQVKYAEAENLAKEILQAYPSDGMALSRLAYIKLQQQKYEEAREWAQKASISNSNLPSAWFYLGMAYQQLNRPAEATTAFFKAIQTKTDWPEAYYRYGVCLYNCGQTFESQIALEKALSQVHTGDGIEREIRQFLAKIKKNE